MKQILNNLCAEIISDNKYPTVTADDLNKEMSQNLDVRAYCVAEMKQIDRDLQRIIQKGKVTESDMDWAISPNPYRQYIRKITDEDISQHCSYAAVAKGLHPMFDLDKDWRHCNSEIRIRYLEKDVFGVQSELAKHIEEADVDCVAYSTTYLGFAMIDYDGKIGHRPFLNRKTRKRIEIEYKKHSGGEKLDWSLVPSLAPFLIERKHKTVPRRNKQMYRAVGHAGDNHYLHMSDDKLNAHVVRLKLARAEYAKVVRCIDKKEKYAFDQSPLPFLTNATRRLIRAHAAAAQTANQHFPGG